MNVMTWIDLSLFFVLFALFIYIFFSVTITNLHKVYLTFHFTMMLWPFCQFALKTTADPDVQLFYVKLAFIDSILLTIGWLLFTIFHWQIISPSKKENADPIHCRSIHLNRSNRQSKAKLCTSYAWWIC